MKVTELVREVCKVERGKKEINIAQMTEALGKVADKIYAEAISAEASDTHRTLLRWGKRRADERLLSRP